MSLFFIRQMILIFTFTMNEFFEILKYVLPGLITFLTTYFLFKSFFDFQNNAKAFELKHSETKTTLPIRLQAYERLSLFSERIALPNLIMRLRTSSSTNQSLHYAMLTSIQQEYEHNISQQIYVSEKLWQIVKISKENMMSIVSNCYDGLNPQGNSEEYVAALFSYLEKNPMPVDMALSAIRSEAGGIF
jgi:hypothetical protein